MCANLASIIDNQPRNVARASGEIDHAHSCAGLEPASHETQHKTITAEPAIKLPKTFQVALQFRGDRLRPIHHFEDSRIEASLHEIMVGSFTRTAPGRL